MVPVLIIVVTTAIVIEGEGGEVSLLLWGNRSLPTVLEGPPLVRGGPSWLVGEGGGELPPPRPPATRAPPLMRGDPSGTVGRDRFP